MMMIIYYIYIWAIIYYIADLLTVAHLADRHGYILCRQHLESAMPSQRRKGKSARSRRADPPSNEERW